jgi:hypothetical protein
MKFPHLILLLSIPTAHATDFIGSIIPPYPEGLTHKQGACIASPAHGFNNICDYSIGILEDHEGKLKTIFGARMTGRDASKKAFWNITDTLPYPTLQAGYFLAIANCQDDGKDDQTIIAAVRATDTEWLKDILWAKRYDLKTGKFVDHASTRVQCANEGWGH